MASPNIFMDRDAMVLRAERQPLPGFVNPGPHQLYRHPRLAVESRPLGQLRPHDLRLEMLYAGICGTDLHFARQDPVTGYIRSSSPASIPKDGRIFGHEGIGRVIAVGSETHDFREGAIVACESIVVCGHCDRCQRGFPNQCRQSRLIGMEQDGLFASVADIPSSIAYDVSSDVSTAADLRALACLEPAGVAWEACRNGHIALSERVVVFGAGPIGLYCAMLARTAFQAGHVQVVEIEDFRRNLAAGLCDQAFTPQDFFASSPNDIDVVIEATGHLGHLDRVLPRMNAGGRIVLLGRSGEPLILAETDCLITNTVSVRGSRGHVGGAFRALIDLYREKRFQPGVLITRVVDGLQELADVLSAPAQLAAHEAKVLVRFPAATQF